MTAERLDLDITAVTRPSMLSQITIRATSGEIRILAGEVDVRDMNGDRAWGRITARALDATDFEHDSAYVFQIPIVQVRLHSVYRGRTMLDALRSSEKSRVTSAYLFRRTTRPSSPGSRSATNALYRTPSYPPGSGLDQRRRASCTSSWWVRSCP